MKICQKTELPDKQWIYWKCLKQFKILTVEETKFNESPLLKWLLKFTILSNKMCYAEFQVWAKTTILNLTLINCMLILKTKETE